MFAGAGLFIVCLLAICLQVEEQSDIQCRVWYGMVLFIFFSSSSIVYDTVGLHGQIGRAREDYLQSKRSITVRVGRL